MDLHNNFPIQNFKCLVLNCHPEYWTKQMTNNVITNAKNIISLAGNVAYRKVIISKNTMIKNNLWSPSTLKKISGSFFTDNDANTNRLILPNGAIIDSNSPVYPPNCFNLRCFNLLLDKDFKNKYYNLRICSET